jgi:murein DD-endopeptidase MepM/ murein hydrolase activator NlpD
MMADILEKQHVQRRTKYTNSRYGGGFVRQLQQKPIRAPRKYRTGGLNKPVSRSGPVRMDKKSGSEQIPRRQSGFSFPVPSFATVLVIAGILVVSLIALNWEGMPSRYTLNLSPDKDIDRTLASFVMNFTPEARVSEAEAETEMEAEVTPAPPPEEDISLDLKETFAWSSYKVKRGDSVFKIASDFAVSMDAVIASNNINNARRLREGDTLRIPNMDGIPYTVKKGDNLSRIAGDMKVPLEVILDANDLRSDAIIAGQTLFIPGARMSPEALKLSLGELFIYPIRKNISSGYGWRADPFTGEQRFHYALDLKGNTGAPVKAAMDGTVAAIVRDSRDFGHYIILKHSGGYRTVYAHLSAFSVKLGDRVLQGNKIGEVGSTGRSTGPHLHFQIYKDGRVINPLDLLH